MVKPKFARCACFFHENIFISSLKEHLVYHNDEQFLHDFSHLLNKEPDLIEKVKSEVNRRTKFVQETEHRRRFIDENYTKKYNDIFDMNVQWLDPRFLQLHRDLVQQQDISHLQTSYSLSPPKFELYQFPVFTSEFCDLLMEELDNFQAKDMPKEKPNTMNNYGLLLDEIGFEQLLNDLRLRYLNDISKFVFPKWTGPGLDSHRGFTVSYSPDTDKDLSLHFDNAEVTINISLTDESSYDGGELIFMGMQDVSQSNLTSSLPIKHKKGYGILHRGRQFHAALPVNHGRRVNLIIWMRSSIVRNNLCPMCSKPPQLMPVPETEFGGTGDGFVVKGDMIDVCNVI